MITESAETYLKVSVPEGAHDFRISNNLMTKILLFKRADGKREHVDLQDCRTSYGITRKSLMEHTGDTVTIFRT